MYIPPDLTAFKEDVDRRLAEEKEENDDNIRRDKEAGLGIAMEY
jgi:histone deacetylase HOS2